jgi:NTE family protein
VSGTAPARRLGIVLGGGGVLGGAWLVGALKALQEVHGIDPRGAEMLVGTSAGSFVAALLGAGVSVDELRAHQMGQSASSGPLAALEWDYQTATGPSSPTTGWFAASNRARLGLGSAGLVAHNAHRLRRLPPTAVIAALVPEGQGSLHAVGRLVRDVQLTVGAPVDGWSPHPGVRAVAMDYSCGHRVAFGSPNAPSAPLADAVMASCAIPGWYSPVVIGGVRYVDGGACSATNVDLLARAGLDEVFVFAPMVSFTLDAPSHWRTRMERAWRHRVTRRCMHEVAKLHAAGTEVTVLGPGREDLEVIGGNLMAVDRRRAVLETSVRTSVEALRDPEPISHPPSGVDLPERHAG